MLASITQIKENVIVETDKFSMSHVLPSAEKATSRLRVSWQEIIVCRHEYISTFGGFIPSLGNSSVVAENMEDTIMCR